MILLEPVNDGVLTLVTSVEMISITPSSRSKRSYSISDYSESWTLSILLDPTFTPVRVMDIIDVWRPSWNMSYS